MINLISDYIPPFSPLPNIAPFTYKDGETYLSTLDNIRTYVNVTLVDFVNTNFALITNTNTEQINILIAEVNTALDNAGNNIAEIQTIHDQVEALVASLPDLTTTLNSINGGVAAAAASADAAATSENNSATNATNAANSATDANVAASNAASASTTAINNQKGQNYGIPGLDGSAILLDANIPTRLADANLKLEFADKSVETIITSGRLSDANLQNEFITTNGNKAIKSFTTYVALLASSGNIGDMAVAINVPGTYFQHDGISWKMIGVAKFADSAAFTAAIAAPVSGMERKLANLYYSEKYLIYPSDGVSVSGWYPFSGILPYVDLRMTAAQNFTTSGIDAAVTWDYEKSNMFDMHSTITNPSRVTITKAGKYKLLRQIVNGATPGSTQYCAAEFALNGAKINGTYSSIGGASVAYAANALAYEVNLAAGDYVEVKASVPTSGTYPIQISETFFIVSYISAA